VEGGAMSWGKFDDGASGHLKVRRAGTAGAMLWWAAVLWSNRNGTDGVIPKDLLGDVWNPIGERFDHAAAARKAVAAGLFHEDGDRYLIHDFHDYNPTAAENAQRRKSAAERAKRSRQKRQGTQEAGHAERAPHVTAHVTRSVTPHVHRESRYPVPSRPDPDPVRETVTAHVTRDVQRDAECSDDVGEGARSLDGQNQGSSSIHVLADRIRAGIVDGFGEIGEPAPKETRSLTWDGWVEIARWVRDKARILGKDDEIAIAKHLVRGFFSARKTRKNGLPVAFLAQNPLEFWRPLDVSEVA
jgi:hypothetical protein